MINSEGVIYSEGVNYSNGVNSSDGVNSSYGVNYSNGVNSSYGVNSSDGVNYSYGIVKCEGISNSIFCFNKSGKNLLFNKKVTPERITEVRKKLNRFNWYPRFNNAEALKSNLEWYETYIPGIVSVDNRTAWSLMPKEMEAYIRSLPEFSERIFKQITGEIKNV